MKTTTAKYKTPILITGGTHATRSEYYAPSTRHMIEITRTRQIGKSAHNDYTPNKILVKDHEGSYVAIPRSVKKTQGAVAKYLFDLSATAENPTPKDPVRVLLDTAKWMLGSLEEQGIKPNGYGALKLAISNYESQQ